MKKVILFVLFTTLFIQQTFAGGCTPSPYNNCGSAYALTVGTQFSTNSCGTTETGESFGTCSSYGAGSHTTWFSFVANCSEMDVTVNKTSGGCAMSHAVYSGGCLPSTATELDCQHGAPYPNISNLTGLAVGDTFYVQVLYSSGGGPCGSEATFTIQVDSSASCGAGGGGCATNASCTDNADCSSAYPLTLTDVGDTATCCFTDCNTGASDLTHVFLGGCSTTDAFQEVWYSFEAQHDYIDINITNADFSSGYISLWSEDCGTVYVHNGECYTPFTGGAGSLSEFSVDSGVTYVISISSATNGDGGNFDLCVIDYISPDVCVTVSDLTRDTPPEDTIGGFEIYYPNTTVEFCYHIDTFVMWNCVYLQAIIPVFGSGWDPASLTLTTNPTSASSDGGSWAWYDLADVAVTHNVSGDTVNKDFGGWFYTSSKKGGTPGNPNLSFGDGCNTGACPCLGDASGFTWDVCFTLTTWDSTTCAGLSDKNLSVTMQTYSDGQIGSWVEIGCEADIPISTPEMDLSCAAAPLPITLLSFAAIPFGNTVKTDWTTLSEVNNDYFTLERSRDGINFEYVGTVEGAGTSTNSINYSYFDYRPHQGLSYYRLKQTDYDGGFKYSKLVAVMIDSENFNGEYEIYDVTGRLIIRPLNQLLSGVYFIVGGNSVHKFYVK